MKRLCVYCGSNTGNKPVYVDAARQLGTALVTNRVELVYGGGAKGLMGILADAVLGAGGKAIGVIPRALMDKEVGHKGLSELHIVESMHERKSMMVMLSDGFVAMPGGYGTLEEIIEVLTWGQLQFHSKPCGLLNVNGFFDDLLRYLDGATASGFVRPQHRAMLLVADRPSGLLHQFSQYVPPDAEKWT
ncbi:MAG: TIGR00730 family Rossman fold protein [Gammaproteobacteria bacterium]|nr:TIGR00730 family Rossman fold protein [Gammaproteobacteria bacterium]MDH4314021.1 TIGR00730 family Rossman fold protein [Gammaproteobacteria bacterium]MDH5214923.1 TIGR00730 family Rossman fold protein [Gammaproteobacteria bacterium]MDH5501241.1 TIGR00730 family Rossman fold protein [Gammaproteobacteria bacterium]